MLQAGRSRVLSHVRLKDFSNDLMFPTAHGPGVYSASSWYYTGIPDEVIEVEVNLRPTVSRPVCLVFVFCLIIAGFFDVEAPSLTRGWVCNVLTSGPCQSSRSWIEVPLTSRPYFTVSVETPATWRTRFPYSYPPGTGSPSYIPWRWVPFFEIFQLT
jgi:hypothetical protein